MTIKSVSGDLMLNVKKTLTNKTLTAGQFEFELLDSNGKSFSPKVTATNDANGNVTLSYAKGIDKDTLKGYEGNTEQDNKYTFYVREVNKGDDNVTYDPHVYKVVVNVQITESHKRQVGSFLTVVTENYAVKSVQFTKGTGTGDNWRPVDGANPGNSATFHNTWKTGSLQVKKVVKGNTLPSDPQEFTFTVDLTGVTGKVDPYTVTGDKNVTKNTRNRIVFTLEAGQTAVIEGIPAGVQYNVTESTLTGYDTTWTGQSGTIGADTAASVTCTNTRKTTELTVKKTVTVGTNSDPTSAPAADKRYTIKVQLGTATTEHGNATAWAGEGIYTFNIQAGEES